MKLTKHITVPAEFIEEQFHRFNRYPIRQRFEAMTDYILDMMKVQYAFTVTTAERNFLKKEIKRMFAGNNDLQVYKDFFEMCIRDRAILIMLPAFWRIIIGVQA